MKDVKQDRLQHLVHALTSATREGRATWTASGSHSFVYSDQAGSVVVRGQYPATASALSAPVLELLDESGRVLESLSSDVMRAGTEPSQLWVRTAVRELWEAILQADAKTTRVIDGLIAGLA